MKGFIEKHSVDTTYDHFKNKYFIAKKRINVNSNFPIDKLELIIPFLKTNYVQAVVKVNNDIIILEEELIDC